MKPRTIAAVLAVAVPLVAAVTAAGLGPTLHGGSAQDLTGVLTRHVVPGTYAAADRRTAGS